MAMGLIYRVRAAMDRGTGVFVVALVPAIASILAAWLPGFYDSAVAGAAIVLSAAALLLLAWPRRAMPRIVFLLAWAVLAGLAAAAAAGHAGVLPASLTGLPGFAWLTAKAPSAVLVLAPSILLALLLARLRGRTAMGFHPRPLSSDLPGPEIGGQLANLVLQLRNDLDILDRTTNWSATQFVALDAEVEVFRGEKRSSTVLDLIEGLVRNRDRQLFIVLGDPGAGKSVALRKLARDLLAEARRTGRIPIYINLKEWRPAAAWTAEQPPSAQDLITFIQSSLSRRLGLSTIGAELLDDQFKLLHETGRLFLILDSFDEIPQLLDIKDAGWLIRALSNMATQLIAGSPEGRGIIASRLFRQPDISRSEYCRLDIRPLSDLKSGQLIDQQPGSAQDRRIVKTAIFAGRADLAAAGRNPLLLTLLIGYVHRNAGLLPPNQYELFRSHMDVNVQRGITGGYKTLTADQVWKVTERIALTMFNEQHFGLDMPLETLRNRLPNDPVELVATFLINAKLGRESQDRSFGFVHRRFNEFFLVQWLLQSRSRAEEQASTIPDDGRWRDALALYVEVAGEAEASAVASLCMEVAEPLLDFSCQPGDAAYIRGLHCLRFLNDAFRGRTALLEPFVPVLARFVSIALRGDDMLVQKNAVETIGLLPPQRADPLIALALHEGGGWVQETAFRACRYLPSLTGAALVTLRAYITSIPASHLIRDFGRLRLLFNLSESLGALRLPLHARAGEAVCAIIVPIILLLSGNMAFWIITVEWPILVGTFAVLDTGTNLITERTLRSKSTDGLDNALRRVGKALGSDGRPISLFTLRALYLVLVIVSIFIMTVLAIAGFVAPRMEGAFLGSAVIDTLGEHPDPRAVLKFFDPLPGLQPYVWVISDHGIMSATLVMLAVVAVTLPYTGLLGLASHLGPRQPGRPRDGSVLKRLAALTGLIPITVVGLGAIWLIRVLTPYIEALGFVPLIFSLVVGVVIAGGVLLHVLRFVLDLRRVMVFRRGRPANRRHISDQFAALHTGYGRLQYVRWLWTLAADLEPDMRGEPWPDNRRPNSGNDAASALLARLDERWLGLAR